MTTSLAYKDSLVNDGTLEYMVKTLALRELASGSYHEMGKGRIASVLTTDVAEGFAPTSINCNVGPNPATTFVNVDLQLSQESPVTIHVVDMTGSVIRTQNFDMLAGGSHSIGFDVSDAASGGYQIVVKTRDQSMVKALTVIR
jgi:hypothetical protein